MRWQDIWVLLIIVAVATIAPASAQSPADEKPWSQQGYLGLRLRDVPGGHTVVSWILPGPLQGEGITAPAVDLARPDLIVAVNKWPMIADEFRDYIRATAPGTQVTITYRKSNNRGGRIPTELDHEDEVRTLNVALGSRDEWSGTIGRGLRESAQRRSVTSALEAPIVEPLGPSTIVGQAVEEHDLDAALTTLLEVFQQWHERDEDYYDLSRIRAAFEAPFNLPQLLWITPNALGTSPALSRWRDWRDQLGSHPIGSATMLACENLDETGRGSFARVARRDPPTQTRIANLLRSELLRTNEWLHHAMRNVPRDETFGLQCVSLLKVPAQTFYISGPGSHDNIAVIRQSMNLDLTLLAHAMMSDKLSLMLKDGESIEPESIDELQAMTASGPSYHVEEWVEGSVIESVYHEIAGWIIIGGAGPNRYDMAHIAAVYDIGGDDEYYATDLRLGSRVIIDLAGNDTYTGTPEQGPGGALLGVSLIDDRAGDDRYEGELLACGAAMYGVSLLLDRAGNDTYIGKEWSIGAGCYGAGMLFDLGAGNDTYIGEFLCQGVGGPRGFGCIVDEGGRDLYRANGPTPSAYGTPAVYQSFSQGIGFGYRQYAAGGIGMIQDLGGDDRYEAGEFAQGGAYYYGLGILHDAKGRDLYYGNRYGQGFGVHQAVGMLVDDEGDDTYWSMTAASQGAAWDIGVGMLLDRAGNDSYQCDGLGQGGASMQAIAMLIDLDGTDRYSARGGAVQGRSGGDSYHHHETGAFSFSLLMDLGGDEDWYSTGHANNTTTSQGSTNDEHPEESTLHGLFIDQ